MIVLFSDFGLEGPYIGQVKAVLAAAAPGVAVIDSFSDAPAFEPQLSAYLLAAYTGGFPPGSVFLAVVDPGVGGDRPCVILRAGAAWFVGPGNGLFELVARRAQAAGEAVAWWALDAVPECASPSFHGRDVFAPAAAALARDGGVPAGWSVVTNGDSLRQHDWPDDLAKIVYIDRFGNALTGLRAETMAAISTVSVSGKLLQKAITFSDVSTGATFWYENSNGLVEIAVNQGCASKRLGLIIGQDVAVGQ